MIVGIGLAYRLCILALVSNLNLGSLKGIASLSRVRIVTLEVCFVLAISRLVL